MGGFFAAVSAIALVVLALASLSVPRAPAKADTAAPHFETLPQADKEWWLWCVRQSDRCEQARWIDEVSSLVTSDDPAQWTTSGWQYACQTVGRVSIGGFVVDTKKSRPWWMPSTFSTLTPGIAPSTSLWRLFQGGIGIFPIFGFELPQPDRTMTISEYAVDVPVGSKGRIVLKPKVVDTTGKLEVGDLATSKTVLFDSVELRSWGSKNQVLQVEVQPEAFPMTLQEGRDLCGYEA